MVLKVTFDTNVFTRFLNLKEGSDNIHYEKFLRQLRARP